MFSEPSEPQTLRLIERLRHNLTVSWAKPSSLNGPLNGYLIGLSGPSGSIGAWETVDSKTTVHSFNEISSHESYMVYVKAFNLVCESQYLESQAVYVDVAGWIGK